MRLIASELRASELIANDRAPLNKCYPCFFQILSSDVNYIVFVYYLMNVCYQVYFCYLCAGAQLRYGVKRGGGHEGMYFINNAVQLNL